MRKAINGPSGIGEMGTTHCCRDSAGILPQHGRPLVSVSVAGSRVQSIHGCLRNKVIESSLNGECIADIVGKEGSTEITSGRSKDLIGGANRVPVYSGRTLASIDRRISRIVKCQCHTPMQCEAGGPSCASNLLSSMERLPNHRFKRQRAPG